MNSAVHTAIGSPVELSVHGITVRFGARTVLDQLTLTIPRGRWTSIVGPNGCGKSTLLRALVGLVPAEQGEVRLDGKPLGAWAHRERARRLAWLPQTPAASDLTVYDTVVLGRFAHTGWLGARTARDLAAIDRSLTATGVQGLRSRKLSSLSGGERQRVSLARLLAVEASALLLDEPTAHLDLPHQIDLARILRQQSRDGQVTVVSAIHEMSLALMADSIIVMGSHGLVGQGTVDDVLNGDWLSQAFGTHISIVRTGTSYAWHPQLSEPAA